MDDGNDLLNDSTIPTEAKHLHQPTTQRTEGRRGDVLLQCPASSRQSCLGSSSSTSERPLLHRTEERTTSTAEEWMVRFMPFKDYSHQIFIPERPSTRVFKVPDGGIPKNVLPLVRPFPHVPTSRRLSPLLSKTYLGSASSPMGDASCFHTTETGNVTRGKGSKVSVEVHHRRDIYWPSQEDSEGDASIAYQKDSTEGSESSIRDSLEIRRNEYLASPAPRYSTEKKDSSEARLTYDMASETRTIDSSHTSGKTIEIEVEVSKTRQADSGRSSTRMAASVLRRVFGTLTHRRRSSDDRSVPITSIGADIDTGRPEAAKLSLLPSKAPSLKDRHEEIGKQIPKRQPTSALLLPGPLSGSTIPVRKEASKEGVATLRPLQAKPASRPSQEDLSGQIPKTSKILETEKPPPPLGQMVGPKPPISTTVAPRKDSKLGSAITMGAPVPKDALTVTRPKLQPSVGALEVPTPPGSLSRRRSSTAFPLEGAAPGSRTLSATPARQSDAEAGPRLSAAPTYTSVLADRVHTGEAATGAAASGAASIPPGSSPSGLHEPVPFRGNLTAPRPVRPLTPGSAQPVP